MNKLEDVYRLSVLASMAKKAHDDFWAQSRVQRDADRGDGSNISGLLLRRQEAFDAVEDFIVDDWGL